jgi:hypothetical protein
MSETDETTVVEETAGEAAPEAVAEAAPEAVAQEEPAAVEAHEEAPEAVAAPAGGRQARVFLCERGHRTVTLWSTPTTCRAHVNRRDECGRQLYPSGELPEQVQKALNPLKASKKSSKKG